MVVSNRLNNVFWLIVKSPIVWGSLAAIWFYKMIDSGFLSGEFVQRYFASHPVEYVATTMFFIGFAVLVLKVFDIIGQYSTLTAPLLGPVSRTRRPAEDCAALQERIQRLPRRRQGDYLVRRVREAVQHVRRQGSAETLDDQLKYLADLDAGRLHSSYALVRVIIWAIPILGFLGTVIGITLAIANLAPEALEDSLPEVTAGLGVAFDTTALALGLSIVLMFAQFLTDRAESALLARVDDRAPVLLQGHFEHVPAGPDGQLMAVRQMAETVVEVTERLVKRQAEIWQSSMEAAGKRWATMADASGQQVHEVLCDALAGSLRAHADQLGKAERSAAEENHRHSLQLQHTQTQHAQAMASLQGEIVKQGEMLGRVLAAVGEVTQLEDRLNRNLAALSGSKNFEQTVMSLAAAIHLLNARLTDVPSQVPPIQLEDDKPNTQAA